MFQYILYCVAALKWIRVIFIWVQSPYALTNIFSRSPLFPKAWNMNKKFVRSGCHIFKTGMMHFVSRLSILVSEFSSCKCLMYCVSALEWIRVILTWALSSDALTKTFLWSAIFQEIWNISHVRCVIPNSSSRPMVTCFKEYDKLLY